MSGLPEFHAIFVSYVALLFILSTPVSGDFKYERTIAFTVEKTSPLGISSEARDIGGYNKNSKQIYLNVGEALNIITGRFKAPLDGAYNFYYSFSSTIMSATTKIRLMKQEVGRDATSQVIQTLTPSVPNPLDSASASVMVEMKHGDEVFLRLEPGLLDVSRERPLLFTGYMVYRDGERANKYLLYNTDAP